MSDVPKAADIPAPDGFRWVCIPEGFQITGPNRSVLQDWVMDLGLREQGTLLAAVRGCDLEPKQWGPDGEVIDSQARRLVAWIRWAVMVPADPREVGLPGAFMQDRPPNPFKPSGLGHLPEHWYAHVMHALEVIGYCCPDWDVSSPALAMYQAMARNLHLQPEGRMDMVRRLHEDRIATGTVVS